MTESVKTERIKWIDYKGKKILFSDMSNAQGDELLEATKEYRDKVLACPPGPILVLLDFTNAKMDKEAVGIAYDVEKQEKEKGIDKTAACIGMTGMKKVIVQGVKRDLHLANSLEEAKDWLATQ